MYSQIIETQTMTCGMNWEVIRNQGSAYVVLSGAADPVSEAVSVSYSCAN